MIDRSSPRRDRNLRRPARVIVEPRQKSSGTKVGKIDPRIDDRECHAVAVHPETAQATSLQQPLNIGGGTHRRVAATGLRCSDSGIGKDRGLTSRIARRLSHGVKISGMER